MLSHRDTWKEYHSIYRQTAYCLGVSDGVDIGIEQVKKGQKTILTLNDMTCLITIYDAIRKLNVALFGYYEIHARDEGIMGALGSIWDVIVNGICTEIKLLGEDESLEKILRILGKETITPREKAKQLLGMK